MNIADTKLTDHEVAALSATFNLADGHARYKLPEIYPQLLEAVQEYLEENKPQEEMERNFRRVFFTAAKQARMLDTNRILYCPTASLSIEIVANFLRVNRLSVSLIEPVFDNLADILKRHHIELHALPEASFHNKGIAAWLSAIKTDVVFLVMPNNPTGYTFSQDELQQIVAFCAENKKLLIIDFCFRFFAPTMSLWDQYALLENAGVKYIVIEDTGKTWATAELKIGTLMSDENTFGMLVSIYRDLFISVSPLSLGFVTRFIEMTLVIGFEERVLSISRTNRRILREALADTLLRPISYPDGSTEWIKVEADIEDVVLVEHLKQRGIYILPGSKFFWSNPTLGARFVRVALMRDANMFAGAVEVLRASLPTVLLK